MSVALGNGDQLYPNGTLITMEFCSDENDDDWNDDGIKDGIIIKYGRFNSGTNNHDCVSSDCCCAKGGRLEWKYMVEFDFDKGEDDCYEPDGCESFIELIPENKIRNYISENCIIKKHFGYLIRRNFIDAENFDVDWDMFCKDFERMPCIANINIARPQGRRCNYFNCPTDGHADSNLSVLFLVMITGCKDRNLIRKLLTKNSSAIYDHFIYPYVEDDVLIRGENFFKDFMRAAPDSFLMIDPVILRLLLKSTEDEKLICFGGEVRVRIDGLDYISEDEYDGLYPVIRFLQRQETSTIMRFLQRQESDENNKAFLIIPQVKVILEESLYVVSKLLGEVYKHGVQHVLLSKGIGSAVSEDVLRFAKIQFESNNTEEIFKSTCFTFSCIDNRYDHCTLLGLMFKSLNEDNRGSFLWYMHMYMKNRSDHDDSILSLVHSVLDDVLPTSTITYSSKNHLSYWTNFWSVFKNDEWKNDDSGSVSGQSKDHQHPLLIAIRNEYQYEVIVDIANKDTTILESFDNHENLPPFALVAARRSYNNSNHANNPGHDDETYTNDLSATYELLRTNPSVIVNITMGTIDNEKNKSPQRVSMNTTNSALHLSRPHKRAKKSIDANEESKL